MSVGGVAAFASSERAANWERNTKACTRTARSQAAGPQPGRWGP